MAGGLVLSDSDFLRRLKKEDGFLPSVGAWDGCWVSACEEDAVWGALGMGLVWAAVLVLGVVRGRLDEYIELTSAVCSLLGGGIDSVCGAFDSVEVFDGCACGFADPPPKTRRKKPGLELDEAAAVVVGVVVVAAVVIVAPADAVDRGCGENNGLLVTTPGEGVSESCPEGTGGRSRNLLALTNSSACARMLGPG